MLADEFPYLKRCLIDPRLIGHEATLSSFAANNSSPRADMWSSHIKQTLVVKGTEFPKIYSGWEQNHGEYIFSKSRRNQDAQVLAVIPKYAHKIGKFKISNNPQITVIWVGLEDRKIYYSTVDTYTRCSDGFGYENVFTPAVNRLQPDQFLPKDEVLVTSPNIKGGAYCYGVNANVAYMTADETIEDAMWISQSLADKLESVEIRRETIIVDENTHPINLYGDNIDFKFIPDIGEYVGDNGILCAFRPITDESFIADTMINELTDIHRNHDKIFYAPPGTKILDLDFYISKNTKIPKTTFDQVEKYKECIEEYYRNIVAVYRQYQGRYELSYEFNTLVTTAIARLAAAGVRADGVPPHPKAKLLNRSGHPIDFLQIMVTYITKRPCSNGFKVTGKQGEKGVICKITPDEDMPTDEQGFKADLVINPGSIVARMNGGQFYEQGINRISEFVRRRVQYIASTNLDLAFETLMDYYNDIFPEHADLIKSLKTTKEKRDAFVHNCIADGIYLHIPPALDTIGFDLIDKLVQKWNVVESPVTYTKRDIDGNIVGTFKTEVPVAIGAKYLVLLGKIPEGCSSGVSHVNQYNTPMKHNARSRYPIRANPMRFGEDEVRVITMDLEDTSEHMRLTCLQANSPIGVEAMINALLYSDKPTQIERVQVGNAKTLEESNTLLARSNTVVALFWHQMNTIGIDHVTVTHEPMPTARRVEEPTE